MTGSSQSKLGDLSPQIWVQKVSVCIAVRYQDELILVTDNRVSFGDFSGEHLSLKASALWHGWEALFAGNDVEHAEPILREAKTRLIALADKIQPRMLRPDEVVPLFDEVYSEHLQAQIEKKILRKHGFDAESFQSKAKLKLTPEILAKVWDRIDKEKISLRFLVCGHEPREDRSPNRGEVHIWVVDGENAPVSYNTIGFWAIGKGAPAALNRIALYLSKHVQFDSLAEALYVAVTAKFVAESVGDVGPSTFAAVQRHITEDNDTTLITPEAIAVIRKSWDETGVPPVPPVMIEMLKRALPVLRRRTSSGVKKLLKKRKKSASTRQAHPALRSTSQTSTERQ